MRMRRVTAAWIVRMKTWYRFDAGACHAREWPFSGPQRGPPKGTKDLSTVRWSDLNLTYSDHPRKVAASHREVADLSVRLSDLTVRLSDLTVRLSDLSVRLSDLSVRGWGFGVRGRALGGRAG